MNAITEVGPHGLRLAPRRYLIRFHSPGGGLSQVKMDGYSPEDAIRRLRRSGTRIPAALVYSVCLLEEIRSSLFKSSWDDEERRQRMYDAERGNGVDTSN